MIEIGDNLAKTIGLIALTIMVTSIFEAAFNSFEGEKKNESLNDFIMRKIKKN